MRTLAKEMGTSEEGTSLWALAQAAKRHGFAARGLALTQKGLAEQRLPVIALITPGHFVLVDAVTPTAVRVWDPAPSGNALTPLSALGPVARRELSPSPNNRRGGMERTLPLAEWQKAWGGEAVGLR